MANNRLYLVHRPSGLAVMIGKRMGFGYYTPHGADISTRLESFYAAVIDAWGNGPVKHSQDDFVIALESGEHQPHALSCGTDWWDIDEADEATGLCRLEIAEHVPYGTPERI